VLHYHLTLDSKYISSFHYNHFVGRRRSQVFSPVCVAVVCLETT
jgi:hypothetical protein